ncbi:MAG: two-component system, chemotaxis family, sensor kinase CheA, partial [Actinomycetota bacterium]|nr:two-component system, chemotaxis family, sensor kinase CheA [Actinomycetota bacterium]
MSAESAWERELRERLLEIFVAEAAERLAALDAALLALEGGASEADSHHLSEAFRQAHTLKGGARAAGLPDVERVSHGLESVFERLRRGAPGGPDTWGAIYAAVDAVRALVAGRAADVDTVVAALAVPGPAAPPPRAPPREPPASANGGGNGDGHPPSAPPVPSAAVGPAGTAPVPVGDTVRVPMARLEGLMAEVRELHVALSGLRQRAVEARALDKGTSRLGLVLRRRRRRPSAAPAPGAVPDDGLDFIDEMGGLRRRLDGDVRRLEQVAADLHDSVRRLRMVPVGVALAGIPRLVRDTATACGKQARIELLGESTEVDRSVLEGIGGALTHLVRNAVDHGLEEPD